MAEMLKPVMWKKFECGGGARWTSACDDPAYNGETCNFSGCGCGTKVRRVGDTFDRQEAYDWFRRPSKRPAKARARRAR